MTLDDAIARAADRSFGAADCATLCDSVGGDRWHALDVLAQELARRYLDGAIDFSTADAVANRLFAFASAIGKMPPFMFSIFQAFDAGECARATDPADTCPELKYTRPLIAAALDRRRRDPDD